MSANRKVGGVSLKAVYVLILTTAFLVSGVLFYSTYIMTTAFNAFTDATDNLLAMEKSAYELMDASDYLTERAQRFTIDGSRRYMDEYFKEAFETKRREESLEKLSSDSNLDDALSLLNEAMDESVKLMNTEYYSMRLVVEAKGYADYPKELKSVNLSAPDISLSADDKMRRATELVLNEDYYEQKNRIRSKWRESLYAIEAKTRNLESRAFSDTETSISYVRAMIIIQALMTIFVVWLTIQLGINPIQRAEKRIRECRPIKESGAKEFRYLAQEYNKLTFELNEKNELLRKTAHTDPLTGVRNRIALNRDAESFLDREITILITDLDRLKEINNACGLEEGDRVLCETADILSEEFGKDYCYRFGGDEFLVVVPNFSEEDFLRKLKNIRGRRPEVRIAGEPSRVEFSFGYSHTKFDSVQNLTGLIAEAEKNIRREKDDKYDPNSIK